MDILKFLVILSLIFSTSNQQNKDIIYRLDGSTIFASDLDKSVQDLIHAASVSGFTITIFNQDTVKYQKAFGYSNISTKDSLQLSHVFDGLSLTKAVFGFIAAQLADEKILDLDKPLQDYLNVPIPEMHFEKKWRGFKNLADDERV